MMTSRATAAAISHSGTSFMRLKVTNTVAKQRLVGDGIEHRAQLALPAESLGEKAIRGIRQGGEREQYDGEREALVGQRHRDGHDQQEFGSR